MRKNIRKSLILAAICSIGCLSNTFAATAGTETGLGAIAIGEGSYSTGNNTMAAGNGAVSTGNGMDRDKLAQILANNKKINDDINTARTKYQNSLDAYNKALSNFTNTHEAYNAVQAKNEKIKGFQAEIDNTLQPNADKADAAYNTAKNEYETLYNDFQNRISTIKTLDFTLYQDGSAAGYNLDKMASDLKTKTETGTSFNEPINFYKNYIQNYIKAEGELRQNKIGYSNIDNNDYYKPIFNEKIKNRYDNISSISNNNYGIEYGGNEVTFDTYRSKSLKKDTFNQDSTITNKPTQDIIFKNKDTDIATLEEWNQAKENIPKYQNCLKQYMDNCTDPMLTMYDNTLKNAILTAFNDKTNFWLKDYEICYYQGQYEATKDLSWLSKKEIAEKERETLYQKYHNDINPYNIKQDVTAKWYKENVTDVEDATKAALKSVQEGLDAQIQTKKKAMDSALTNKNAADKALADKQEQIRTTTPTDTEKADAAKDAEDKKAVDDAKAKLDADQEALDNAKKKLSDIIDITNMGSNGLAYGTDSLTTGNDAISMGTKSLTTGDNAIAIGKNSTVTGENSTALGAANTVSTTNAGAFGTGNTVSGENTYVMGNNINTSAKNSVVLGNGSTTNQDNTVSVGSETLKRKITNMGQGAVTASSSEAVTGAQLYSTNQQITGFAQDIQKNTTKLSNMSTSVTNANESATTAVTLANDLDSSKADTSLSNLSEGGRLIIEQAANEAVQKYFKNSTAKTTANVAKTMLFRMPMRAPAPNPNQSLEEKADISYVNEQLETKADKEELNKKADITYVDSGLSKKADKTFVEANLKLKADKSYVDKNFAETNAKIDLKAASDASNIDVNKFTQKLDTGAVEANNKGLVSGSKVYDAVKDKADKDYVNLIGISLDQEIKGTAQGLHEEIIGTAQGLHNEIQQMGNSLNKNINKAAAGANALSALHPMEYDPDDKMSFAAGYGHYKGANATAIGAYYYPNANTMISVGTTIGNGSPSVNAGISVKLGKGSAYNGISKAEMVQRIEKQDEKIAQQEKENKNIKNEIEKLKEFIKANMKK